MICHHHHHCCCPDMDYRYLHASTSFPFFSVRFVKLTYVVTCEYFCRFSLEFCLFQVGLQLMMREVFELQSSKEVSECGVGLGELFLPWGNEKWGFWVVVFERMDDGGETFCLLFLTYTNAQTTHTKFTNPKWPKSKKMTRKSIQYPCGGVAPTCCSLCCLWVHADDDLTLTLMRHEFSPRWRYGGNPDHQKQETFGHKKTIAHPPVTA